jgi:hypothetical protein
MGSRVDDILLLYSSARVDPDRLNFEKLAPPCGILNLLTVQDVNELNRIASSAALSGNPTKKLKMIDDIMVARGFKKLAKGTNRVVYKFMEDQSFVIKVAFDKVGLSDSINEYYNQEFLKPFCTKVFEVTPCGTVGLFERVRAIRNKEEFASVAERIYDIIVMKFLGKYILDDFGTKFFMNWGIRLGVCPVILDFPYMYEADYRKLFCNRPDPTNQFGFCGGEIDYDDGFNHLICTKCGKSYLATELKINPVDRQGKPISEKGDLDMIIEVKRGENVILKNDTTKESNTYRRPKENRAQYKIRKSYQKFKVEIHPGTPIETQEPEPELQQPPVSSGIYTDTSNSQNLQIQIHHRKIEDIPNSTDYMFKDMDVKLTTRDKKTFINGVSEESIKENAASVENTIDVIRNISMQATQIVQDMADQVEEAVVAEQAVAVAEPEDEIEEAPPVELEPVEEAEEVTTAVDEAPLEGEVMGTDGGRPHLAVYRDCTDAHVDDGVTNDIIDNDTYKEATDEESETVYVDPDSDERNYYLASKLAVAVGNAISGEENPEPEPISEGLTKDY